MYYYKENLNPNEIVLGVGYGIYSMDLEGYAPWLLSILTSGSKPENLEITNRLLPLTKAFKSLIYLPVLPKL